MKQQAYYSLLCAIYFVSIFSIPTTKMNSASFLNYQQETISNNKPKEYTFDGPSWKTITMQDIDAIPADIETVTFSFTHLKTLPDELFKKISNVRRIVFERNKLLEYMPKSFYELTHVKSLNLYFTYAIYSLPSNFDSLEDLSITVIHLGDTISILKSIKDFKNLKSLSMSSNNLYTLPSPLFDLKQLESLDVSRNWLKEVDTRMLDMPNLKHLDFSYNSLTSFINIKAPLFTQLESFNLSHNKFSPFFTGKKSAYDTLEGSIVQTNTSNPEKFKLKRFYIAENGLELSPKILRWYAYVFQNLEILDMRDSKVQTLPSFVYDLHNLKYLDVRENHLTDDIARLKDMHIETLLY